MIKKLLLIFVLCFLPGLAQAVDVQEVTGKTGLKAWFVEEHSLPIVSIKIAFSRSGGAYDPAGKLGLAYMVANLLDEGAGDLDELAFKKQLEEHAIYLDFDITEDYFAIEIKTLTENLGKALHLMEIAITNPHFDTNDVNRIRDQLVSMIAKKEEDPEYVATREWKKAAFGTHPYGRPPYGVPSDLASIQRADLTAYTKTHFTRSNITIGAVGDINQQQIIDMLDTYFTKLPATGSSEDNVLDVTISNHFTKPVFIEKTIPQSIAMFGFQGLKRNDPDFYPAYIINYVLGGGVFESRLMQEVREKKGLAYSVYTYMDTSKHAGTFNGSVATQTSKLDKSLDIIHKEIKKLQQEGITQEELNNAKRYLIGSFPLELDRNDRLVDFVLNMQLEQLGITFLNDRNGKISSISLKDANRVAKQLLAPDNMLTVIVGNHN